MIKKTINPTLFLGVLISTSTQFLFAADFCPAFPPSEPSQTIIRVTPSQASNLPSLISQAEPDTTFLFADGTYVVPATLVFKKPRITLRSESGNREKVVLDGEYNINSFLKINTSHITLVDLTLTRVKHHLVHADGGGHFMRFYNVQFIDGGQQFLKVNPPRGVPNITYNDDGLVACSHFELTDEGEPHVSDLGGSLRCYTGGIDAHQIWRWVIRDNTFEGIYCKDAGLAEHAIHVWRTSRDTLVERNIIKDCARGIGFGLNGKGILRDYPDDPVPGITGDVEHIDGIIRNNFVYADIGNKFETGIALESAIRSEVYHNTVFSPTREFTSIKVNYPNSTPVIKNNLIFRDIRVFNNGDPTLENNVVVSDGNIYVDAANGDLRLTQQANTAIDQGLDLRAIVSEDIDGESRDANPDVGADEFGSGSSSPDAVAPAAPTALRTR